MLGQRQALGGPPLPGTIALAFSESLIPVVLLPSKHPGVSYQTLLLKTLSLGLREGWAPHLLLVGGSSQNPNSSPRPPHLQLLPVFPPPSKLEVGVRGGRASSPHLLCNAAWAAHALSEDAGVLGICCLLFLSLIPDGDPTVAC